VISARACISASSRGGCTPAASTLPRRRTRPRGSPFTEPWFPPAGGAAIPGDLDGDGTVGILDFLALLGAWGPCPAPCPPACAGDLNGNVGIADFLALLANWG